MWKLGNSDAFSRMFPICLVKDRFRKGKRDEEDQEEDIDGCANKAKTFGSEKNMTFCCD